MSTFESKPVTVGRSAAEIAAKFDDLSALQPSLDNMSAEERSKVGDVKFEKDSISIQTPQVGEIKFKVVDRRPDKITMEAAGAPVPLKLVLDIKPLTADSCEITSMIDVEIPAFLKPMIGGTMQKAADQFGKLMSKLA